MLVLWLAVAAGGYAYFWQKNPTRQLDAVISYDHATEVGEQFELFAAQDLRAYITSMSDPRQLPSNFAGVKVADSAQAAYKQLIQTTGNSVIQTIRTDGAIDPKDAAAQDVAIASVTTESNGSSVRARTLMGPSIGVEVALNVSWTIPDDETAGDGYPSSGYGSWFQLKIDRATKEIVSVE